MKDSVHLHELPKIFPSVYAIKFVNRALKHNLLLEVSSATERNFLTELISGKPCQERQQNQKNGGLHSLFDIFSQCLHHPLSLNESRSNTYQLITIYSNSVSSPTLNSEKVFKVFSEDLSKLLAISELNFFLHSFTSIVNSIFSVFAAFFAVSQVFETGKLLVMTVVLCTSTTFSIYLV